jgi:hypothetical protein
LDFYEGEGGKNALPAPRTASAFDDDRAGMKWHICEVTPEIPSIQCDDDAVMIKRVLNDEIVALSEHANMHRVDGIGVTSSREIVDIGRGHTLIDEKLHSAASR